MIKTLTVEKQEILDIINTYIDEMSNEDNLIEIDVNEELVSDLNNKMQKEFTKKASLLELMAKIQEDM